MVTDKKQSYIIKVSMEDSSEMLQRQSPGNNFLWRNYKFIFNEDIKEADFWVMHGKGRRKNETCLVSPQNIIFSSGEPDSVYHYSNKFLNQFSVVLAPSDKIKHPHKIYSQCAIPWYIGISFQNEKEVDFTKNYDYFKSAENPEKTRLLSVISSNRAITAGHQKRIDFVLKLKDYYGDKIDLFGKGFNDIDDKWEAIAPYKYHIALENSSFPHYWSEKLADTYLGGAFPFYYGCPNIDEYFSEDSLLKIDIDDFKKSVKIIDDAIASNYAETHKNQILEAKHLLLDKYNFYNVFADICDHLNPNAPKETITLRHELSYKNFNKVKMKFSRAYFNLKKHWNLSTKEINPLP